MIDVEKLMEEKSKLIDKELERVIPKGGIANLYDGIWYHLSTGGKRLRPILGIVTCEALGCDSKKILPFAAACELLHNWLLVHDDIEDNDRVRRDREAVWVKYGIAHGINIGDLMSEKVYELVLRSRDAGVDSEEVLQLIDAMIFASIKTAEGQAMDINLRANNDPTENDYMETVIKKTAYYMTVPMVGAAIVAGRDEFVERMIEFGKNAGPAFQIADDVLDLTEGKGRREIGRDIKEGKRSILVVHSISKCGNEEKSKLLGILNKPVDKTGNDDILWVTDLFKKYGSIDYAKKRANEMIKTAKDSITELPEELRDFLNYFADYLIKRKK